MGARPQLRGPPPPWTLFSPNTAAPGHWEAAPAGNPESCRPGPRDTLRAGPRSLGKCWIPARGNTSPERATVLANPRHWGGGRLFNRPAPPPEGPPPAPLRPLDPSPRAGAAPPRTCPTGDVGGGGQSPALGSRPLPSGLWPRPGGRQGDTELAGPQLLAAARHTRTPRKLGKGAETPAVSVGHVHCGVWVSPSVQTRSGQFLESWTGPRPGQPRPPSDPRAPGTGLRSSGGNVTYCRSHGDKPVLRSFTAPGSQPRAQVGLGALDPGSPPPTPALPASRPAGALAPVPGHRPPQS